jgi:addiction module HigA family antidote
MMNKVNSQKASRSAEAELHKLPTPQVGEILREEFLDPLGITAYRLAKEINVSTTTVLAILNCNRKITVDTALRLSRFFGNSERFWLNLQNDIDLRNQRDKLHSDLKKITPLKRIA